MVKVFKITYIDEVLGPFVYQLVGLSWGLAHLELLPELKWFFTLFD
jgi:hypothetical protein